MVPYVQNFKVAVTKKKSYVKNIKHEVLVVDFSKVETASIQLIQKKVSDEKTKLKDSEPVVDPSKEKPELKGMYSADWEVFGISWQKTPGKVNTPMTRSSLTS